MNSKIETIELKLKQAEILLNQAEAEVIFCLDNVKNHSETDLDSFASKCISYDASYQRLVSRNQQVVIESANLRHQRLVDAHERKDYSIFMEVVEKKSEPAIYEKYPSNLEGQMAANFAKLVFGA